MLTGVSRVRNYERTFLGYGWIDIVVHLFSQFFFGYSKRMFLVMIDQSATVFQDLIGQHLMLVLESVGFNLINTSKTSKFEFLG